MKQIEKRIVLLEIRAEDRRRERMKHEPFYEVVPNLIIGDEVHVFYYPEGAYRLPEKYEGIPFVSAVEWATEKCKSDYIIWSMDSCVEWLMLRTQNDCKYTEDQKEKSKERWIFEYPELALL